MIYCLTAASSVQVWTMKSVAFCSYKRQKRHLTEKQNRATASAGVLGDCLPFNRQFI